MKQTFIIVCVLCFVSCQGSINEPAAAYYMEQNYPNPFTDSTVIVYGIPYAGQNAFGPHIRIVVNDRFNSTQAVLLDVVNHPAGSHLGLVWNGRGSGYQQVPPGMYYIELQQLDTPNDGDTYVHVRRAALKQ
jgi:hypothetical protein